MLLIEVKQALCRTTDLSGWLIQLKLDHLLIQLKLDHLQMNENNILLTSVSDILVIPEVLLFLLNERPDFNTTGKQC